ncbi:hypothetical protein MP638_002576, partial [Amoeboaphelidium occidentale]
QDAYLGDANYELLSPIAKSGKIKMCIKQAFFQILSGIFSSIMASDVNISEDISQSSAVTKKRKLEDVEKEEYEETEDQSVFTVKSGIMTFLKDTDLKKPFLEALEDVVRRASLLRYLAAQFLYFVMLKHLENGSEIPNIMNNTGGLMRQCFVSMSTGQSQYVKKNIEIRARHDHINTLASEFKQLNSIEDSSLPDFKGLSHVLAQCVKENDTNCKTHVSVNLFK